MAEKRPSRYTRDSRESDERFRQQMERDEKMREGPDIPGPLRALVFIGCLLIAAAIYALGVA